MFGEGAEKATGGEVRGMREQKRESKVIRDSRKARSQAEVKIGG
jgi:hypothetical protein